mmetsp:Transcript_19108/g.56089  ORF Transcript_19108/g.56089 Transcript_19108/m.56089 type:complete len:203 (+) Transcript_19108:311-919(+)
MYRSVTLSTAPLSILRTPLKVERDATKRARDSTKKPQSVPFCCRGQPRSSCSTARRRVSVPLTSVGSGLPSEQRCTKLVMLPTRCTAASAWCTPRVKKSRSRSPSSNSSRRSSSGRLATVHGDRCTIAWSPSRMTKSDSIPPLSPVRLVRGLLGRAASSTSSPWLRSTTSGAEASCVAPERDSRQGQCPGVEQAARRRESSK